MKEYKRHAQTEKARDLGDDKPNVVAQLLLMSYANMQVTFISNKGSVDWSKLPDLQETSVAVCTMHHGGKL